MMFGFLRRKTQKSFTQLPRDREIPDREKLAAQLAIEEGLSLKPYRDTHGNLTTGIGRNLDGNPLTPEEIEHIGHDGRQKDLTTDQAYYLLGNDINRAIRFCQRQYWWRGVADDEVRARVMVNLYFNMGADNNLRNGGLDSFVNTLAAVADKNWTRVGAGLRNSKWARDVKKTRANRLIKMIETGNDYK